VGNAEWILPFISDSIPGLKKERRGHRQRVSPGYSDMSFHMRNFFGWIAHWLKVRIFIGQTRIHLQKRAPRGNAKPFPPLRLYHPAHWDLHF
jgi:hypothetical protein